MWTDTIDEKCSTPFTTAPRRLETADSCDRSGTIVAAIGHTVALMLDLYSEGILTRSFYSSMCALIYGELYKRPQQKVK